MPRSLLFDDAAFAHQGRPRGWHSPLSVRVVAQLAGGAPPPPTMPLTSRRSPAAAGLHLFSIASLSSATRRAPAAAGPGHSELSPSYASHIQERPPEFPRMGSTRTIRAPTQPSYHDFRTCEKVEGTIRTVACAAPSMAGGRPHMYEGTLHRYCRAKYR